MSSVSSRSVRRSAPAAAASPAVAGFRPRLAAAAVATAFALQPLVLQAQPAGAQVIHGQALLTGSGSNLLVTTTNGAGTNHSAINWHSFSVPAGSTTHFLQPSATSTSINRVTGPDPSSIYGTLSSNGKLVLVNPAGIAVGPGGVVDTAGFTASTLGLSEADAVAGRLLFQGGAGTLQVDGQVIARGGDVVLIGSRVQTGAAAIVQSDGAAILAAGQKVEITGRGLEGIRMEVQAGNEAIHLGKLQGDAVGMFAATLRHSGVVQAQAVGTEGGKVVLKAIGGDAVVDGSITAVRGDRGGSIDVLGTRVALEDGAALRASGRLGGGQVRIGGDYQGGNADVPNAARTYVAAGASIHADATGQGDGGRVIVWADEVTGMHGQISARGGAQGGDGGFAEVSGKESLRFTGSVDLRAPQGSTGTLLLDPNNITIVATGRTDTSKGAVFSGGPDPATILESDLEAQLKLSSVIVSTDAGTSSTGGTITVDAGVNIQWDTANTLGLQADEDIMLKGSFTATNRNAVLSLHALNGNIWQDSFSSVVDVGFLQINVDDGNVTMGGANRVDVLAARAIGKTAGVNTDIWFNNAKDLTIGSAGSPYGALRSGLQTTDLLGNKGAVTVTAAGNLLIRDSIDAGTIDLEGSTVTLINGAVVRSSGGTGAYISTTGDGVNDLSGGTLVSDGYLDVGGNGSFTLGNVKAVDFYVFGGSAATPTTFRQKAGTTIEAGGLYSSLGSAPGSLLEFTNAGNKIGEISVYADGDVKITSSTAMNVITADGTNVVLTAASITAGADSGIYSDGNVSLAGLGSGSNIDFSPAFIYAGGNLDFSNAGDVVLGETSANTLTANLAGSLRQAPTASVYTPGGITANVKGSIDLPGDTSGTYPNVLGYVSGSAGGNIVMHGVNGVAAGGLSAGGSISLVADTGERPAEAAVLVDGQSLMMSVPTALGDLDIVGSLTAGSSITLSSGTGVVIQDTSTVTAPSIQLLAPLTSVFGTLQPGGAGGIGSVRASGAVQFGGSGTMQLDVASLSSFDMLSVGGTATTASTTAIKVVDLTGGTLSGSFSPVSAADGSSLAFALPPSWSVTGPNPYVITAAGTIVVAPPPPPPPLEQQVAQQQVTGQVAQFSSDFVETVENDEDTQRIGKDDIVVTDTGCRPQ